MGCSTRRIEQVAKLLAEEMVEKKAGRQNVSEMENLMREMVKEAANAGMCQTLEQGEEKYASPDVRCACGEQAGFVSKRAAVLWTVFGIISSMTGPIRS